ARRRRFLFLPGGLLAGARRGTAGVDRPRRGPLRRRARGGRALLCDPSLAALPRLRNERARPRGGGGEPRPLRGGVLGPESATRAIPPRRRSGRPRGHALPLQAALLPSRPARGERGQARPRRRHLPRAGRTARAPARRLLPRVPESGP